MKIIMKMLKRSFKNMLLTGLLASGCFFPMQAMDKLLQDQGLPKLHRLVVQDLIDELREYLKQNKVPMDEIDTRGRTALSYAVGSNKPHTVETILELLKAGANVNATCKNNSTPLHLAAAFGASNTVDLLIRHGATLEAQHLSHNARNSTPLTFTVDPENEPSHFPRPLEQKIESVKSLLFHGANPNHCNEDHHGIKHSALWTALSGKRTYTEILALLIYNGAEMSLLENALLHLTDNKLSSLLTQLLGTCNDLRKKYGISTVRKEAILNALSCLEMPKDLARIVADYSLEIFDEKGEPFPLQKSNIFFYPEVQVGSKKPEIQVSKKVTNYCAVCNKPAQKRCSICKKIYYCSLDCQKNGWEKHKAECKKSN